MPQAVYNQIKWKLKDYERLKQERLDLLHGLSGPPDGMPRGSGIGNPTEQKAMRLDSIERELEAIEQSCMEMIGERSGKACPGFDPVRAYWSYEYFNAQHIRRGKNDLGPCRMTWHRFKDRLTEKIAERMNLI